MSRLSVIQWIQLLTRRRRLQRIYGIAKEMGLSYKVVYASWTRFRIAITKGKRFERRLWRAIGPGQIPSTAKGP